MPNSAFDSLPALSPISPPSHGLTKKSNSSDDAGFDQVLQRASDSSRSANDRANQADSESRPTDRTPDENLESPRSKLKSKTADGNDRVARKDDSRRADRTETSRTSRSSAKNQKDRPSRADGSHSVKDSDSDSKEVATTDDVTEDDATDTQSASNSEVAGTVTCAPNAGKDSTAGESSIDVQANIDDEAAKSDATSQDAAKTGVANSPDPTTTVTVAANSDDANQPNADQSPQHSSGVEIVQPVAVVDKKSQAAAAKGNLQQQSIQVSQADSCVDTGATSQNAASGLSATNATASLKDASQKEENSDAKAGEHSGSKSGENQGQSANLQTSVDATYAAAASAGVQMSSAIASAQSSVGATSDTPVADDHRKNDDEVKSVTDIKRSAATDRAAASANADDAASNAPGQVSANNRTNNRTSGAQAPAGSTTVDPARFVQRVARAFKAADEQGGEIRLRLNPPELGALKVEVAVRDGVMNARLEAETPHARSLLLEHLPALRERLADQQIKIDRFDVDLRQDSAGGGFANPSPDYGDQRFTGGAAQSIRRGSSFPTGSDQTIAPSPATNTVDGKINVIV